MYVYLHLIANVQSRNQATAGPAALRRPIEALNPNLETSIDIDRHS